MKHPMKKEVLIAILIGFGLGLSITYGIYRVRLALQEDPTTIADIVSSTPTPSPEGEALLSILNPVDGSIQEQTATTVTGSTIPNSMVVLFVNNEDYIQSSDNSGSFSFEVELETGSNVLTTHVLNDTGQVVSRTSTVIVSNLYSEDSPLQATDSASTTNESNDET